MNDEMRVEEKIEEVKEEVFKNVEEEKQESSDKERCSILSANESKKRKRSGSMQRNSNMILRSKVKRRKVEGEQDEEFSS